MRAASIGDRSGTFLRLTLDAGAIVVMLTWLGHATSGVRVTPPGVSPVTLATATMQPRYVDGPWLSVALEGMEHEPRPAAVDKNSYQPIILPWSSPANGIAVAISENAVTWRDAIAHTTLYRPAVFELDWRVDPEAQIEELIGALGA